MTNGKHEIEDGDEPEIEDASDAAWDSFSDDLWEKLFSGGPPDFPVPCDEDGYVDSVMLAMMLGVAIRALTIIAQAPHFEGAAFIRRTVAAYTLALLKNREQWEKHGKATAESFAR